MNCACRSKQSLCRRVLLLIFWRIEVYGRLVELEDAPTLSSKRSSEQQLLSKSNYLDPIPCNYVTISLFVPRRFTPPQPEKQPAHAPCPIQVHAMISTEKRPSLQVC
jgi:hypothetical protein